MLEGENLPTMLEMRTYPKCQKVKLVFGCFGLSGPLRQKVKTYLRCKKARTCPQCKKVRTYPQFKGGKNLPTMQEGKNLPPIQEGKNLPPIQEGRTYHPFKKLRTYQLFKLFRTFPQCMMTKMPTMHKGKITKGERVRKSTP